MKPRPTLKPCETGACPFDNRCKDYTRCLNDQLNKLTTSAREDG